MCEKGGLGESQTDRIIEDNEVVEGRERGKGGGGGVKRRKERVSARLHLNNQLGPILFFFFFWFPITALSSFFFFFRI